MVRVHSFEGATGVVVTLKRRSDPACRYDRKITYCSSPYIRQSSHDAGYIAPIWRKCCVLFSLPGGVVHLRARIKCARKSPVRIRECTLPERQIKGLQTLDIGE